MDTPDKPKRPWWRKKRWRITGALWFSLPVLYVLSIGPTTYALERGWVTEEGAVPFYRPLHPAYRAWPAFHLGVLKYSFWWDALGRRHREEEEASDPTVNRRHWTQPNGGDGINRNPYSPPAVSD